MSASALIFALGLASCFAAGELAFVAPTTVDELQTVNIVARCQEANPIIGECGQRVSVGLYFFAFELGHALVSYLLPPSARVWWQGVTIGTEVHTAWRNHLDGFDP